MSERRSNSQGPLIAAVVLAVVGGGVLFGGRMMSQNLTSQANQAKVDLAKTTTKNLFSAVELYRVKNGAPPDTLEQLKSSGIISQLNQDPWGSAFVLVKEGETMAIVSPGPDKKLGTDDDIQEK